MWVLFKHITLRTLTTAIVNVIREYGDISDKYIRKHTIIWTIVELVKCTTVWATENHQYSDP